MSFWTNKLNGIEQTSTPVITRNLYGLHQPVYIPGTISQQQSIPGQYTPSVRMVEGDSCPQCGTDSYRTYGSYAITCIECGYHPRFTQEGSGIRIPREAGVIATPARQLDSGGTNLRGQIEQFNVNQHQNISNIN